MEAPEFIATGYYGLAGNNHFSPENRCYEQKFGNNNQFTVDDLLDFSKEDEVMSDAFFDNLTGNCSDISTSTVVDSCNSSISGSEPQFSGNNGCRSFADAQFSSELCFPYEDLAELEWLSSFVDDSFSSNDSHINLHHLIPIDTSSSQTRSDSAHHRPVFPSAAAVPGKARSKRSRAPPCDWSSRLLLLQQHTSNPRTPPLRKRETATETPGRTCLHCGSDKTPQWRAGPLGPKTLCNACGVRYKSGRLVPEYRPAASPTFVAAKHSNSHRKVIELRRLKEMQREQILGQSSIFGGSNGGDYLIHRQISGSDYRHMV